MLSMSYLKTENTIRMSNAMLVIDDIRIVIDVILYICMNVYYM